MRFSQSATACALAIAALTSCGKKGGGEEPQRAPSGKGSQDLAKGNDAVAVPLVSSSERAQYLDAYAANLIEMVQGSASAEDIAKSLTEVCPQFQQKFRASGDDGKPISPLCTGELPDIDTVTLLKRVGSARDHTTLLGRAVRMRDAAVVEALLPYSDLNASDSAGKTLAMLAAELGKKETFLLLALKSTDLATPDASGCNVVCWAQKSAMEEPARAEFVKVVQDELNFAERKNLDAMLLAEVTNGREKRDLAKIRRLVDAKASLDVAYGENPPKPIVVLAFENLDGELFNLLIKGGAKLDLTMRTLVRASQNLGVSPGWRPLNLRQYGEWVRATKRKGIETDARLDAAGKEKALQQLETEIGQLLEELKELEATGRLAPAAQ